MPTATMILDGLRDSASFSLSFICSTCNQFISATFALGKDGIELLSSPTDSRPLNSSPCKRVSAVTSEGKLSISCGCCRSGRTILTLSRTNDGISSLSVNCERAANEIANNIWENGFRSWTDSRLIFSDIIKKYVYQGEYMRCNARILIGKTAESYCQRDLGHPDDDGKGGHSLYAKLEDRTPTPKPVQHVIGIGERCQCDECKERKQKTA